MFVMRDALLPAAVAHQGEDCSTETFIFANKDDYSFDNCQVILN